MKNSDTIVHRFFRVKASAIDDRPSAKRKRVHGLGHICVAVRACKSNGKRFRVAASFKSPADRLDREFGVMIADGRLNVKRSGRSFLVTATSAEAAAATALDTMLTKTRKQYSKGKATVRPFVPDWLYEAVVQSEHPVVALKR